MAGSAGLTCIEHYKDIIMKILKISAIFLFILSTVAPLRSEVIVAGYYPGWVKNSFPVEKIKFSSLTHIMHAFAWPASDGSLSSYESLKHPQLFQAAKDNNVKVILSVGGAGNSKHFAAVSADSVLRKTFIDNLINFCKKRGYQGIDIDWEYPENNRQKQDMVLFIKELREALTNWESSTLLTMAVSAGDWFGRYFDYTALKPYIDWFGCMTYDFFGSWVNRSGYNSPLFPPLYNNNGSAQSAVRYLNQTRKIPKNKILLGIPFYGYQCNAGGYNQTYTGTPFTLSYAEIYPKITNGWNYHWDSKAKVPYLINDASTKFITYDDTQSVRLKCEYALNQNLAGVMMWSLNHDVTNGTRSLLETIGLSLGLSTSVKTAPSLQPQAISLSACYPNPFNPVTRLNFQVVQQGKIYFKIYNSQGRLIKTLLDGQIKKVGLYELELDLSDKASGVYFALLQQDGVRIFRKLVLLK